MNDLEKKYIDNSLRAIETYIKSIRQLLIDINGFDKSLLDRHKTHLKYDTLNFKNDLKMSILSTILSNNYDSIIGLLDDDIKRKMIENEPTMRASTYFSFENGGFFDAGRGLHITKINPRTVGNYDKILILIRNSISHSKFTLDGDQIYIVNRDFEATIDIKWLEMMTLSIFGNTGATNKKGASDGVLLTHDLENISITSEEEMKYILKNSNYLNMTFLEKNEVFIDSFRQSIGMALSKYRTKGETLIAVEALNKHYAGKVLFKLEPLTGDFLKMMNDTNFFFYNIGTLKYILESKKNPLIQLDYETVNSNTHQIQVQTLANMHASYYSIEKRNTLAYKYILEFMDMIEKNKITQIEVLERSIVIFANIMQQLLIKSYFNVVFNYTIEKNKHANIDIVGNLNKNYSLPDYIGIRNSKIRELGKLLRGNLGGNERQKISAKIERLLKEIEEYKNGTFDRNEILKEKFRNAFVHGNVDFNPVFQVEDMTIRDYDDKKQNFKLKIETQKLFELSDDIYTQLIKNNQR